MPGWGQDMAAYGGKKDIQLGKKLDGFIKSALPDFTHMTVLIYLVRGSQEGCTAGNIARLTGDPKREIQKVLDRFKGLELVRVSGGLLNRKYAYEHGSPQAQMVTNLLKLWRHPQSHGVILRKILDPKA